MNISSEVFLVPFLKNCYQTTDHCLYRPITIAFWNIISKIISRLGQSKWLNCIDYCWLPLRLCQINELYLLRDGCAALWTQGRYQFKKFAVTQSLKFALIITILCMSALYLTFIYHISWDLSAKTFYYDLQCIRESYKGLRKMIFIHDKPCFECRASPLFHRPGVSWDSQDQSRIQSSLLLWIDLQKCMTSFRLLNFLHLYKIYTTRLSEVPHC